LAIIVGKQVGKLGEIHLGGGPAREVVETTPPAFELLLVGFGTILGHGGSSDCVKSAGSQKFPHGYYLIYKSTQ
jgi:hypothetical protein